MALAHEVHAIMRLVADPAPPGRASLDKEDVFGAVTPGSRADLLVLGKNPLDDIRNTRALEFVIAAGDAVDRSSLLVRD
jgi:hypothetical protein